MRLGAEWLPVGYVDPGTQVPKSRRDFPQFTEQSMKTLASALLCCALLASMAGCIPIGVRGSTFAAVHPSVIAPPG